MTGRKSVRSLGLWIRKFGLLNFALTTLAVQPLSRFDFESTRLEVKKREFSAVGDADA